MEMRAIELFLCSVVQSCPTLCNPMDCSTNDRDNEVIFTSSTVFLSFGSTWSISWTSLVAQKASTYNAGDPGSVPGLGRSCGEGNDNPLQYSWLENPMDRAAG